MYTMGMLDIQFIRENTETVKSGARKKHIDVDIDRLLELDERRRDLQGQVDALRSQRNRLSSAPGGGKPPQEQIEQVKQIKEQLAAKESELDQVETDYNRLMLQVPNPPDESVPEGEDDGDNQAISHRGEAPAFSFAPKDHLQLGRDLDLIDTETAAKTSGTRFYYLKNDAVLLEFALSQWILTKLVSKGFTPIIPPQLVRGSMMEATGFFPADANEIYHVNPEEDDLYLIGTSEVPLAGLHMFEPIGMPELPKRYVGFSTCFRREAGSYGKDTHGIMRVHQFDKLEMFSFTHPDGSWDEHEFLLSLEEEILQELELPYRVVNICGGDLGPAAAKKYDCEAWIPSQDTYRELTSCSNTLDFQARRGGIKYVDGDESYLAHTLNGTAMASTRTLLAILENYQTSGGSVRIPEVLQPYVNKEVIT